RLVIDGAPQRQIQTHVRQPIAIAEDELLLSAAAKSDQQHRGPGAVDLRNVLLDLLRVALVLHRWGGGPDDHLSSDFRIDALTGNLGHTGSSAADEYRDAGVIAVAPVEAREIVGAGNALSERRAQQTRRGREDLTVAGDHIELRQQRIEVAIGL